MPIKRHQDLIHIQRVRVMLETGSKFECRYDLVGTGQNGSPQYNCIYLVPKGDGKMQEQVLIRERIDEEGIHARVFSLARGLFVHHHQFGDGTDICIDKDYVITTGRHRGHTETDT